MCLPWPEPTIPDDPRRRSGLVYPLRKELSFRFPQHVAERVLESADPDLHERLSRAGDEELIKLDGSIGAKVRHLIHRGQPQWPTLEEAASALGLSRRTLVRRLESEGLGYQGLLDDARNELACWYLRHTMLPCFRRDLPLAKKPHGVRDALMKLKAVDPTLSFRRSCREGVCGSDAMNINGKNGLACLTNMRTLGETIVLKPLPGLPVMRDLIVDMTQFFTQYDSIKPYLVNDTPPPEKERLQSPEERDELNGLYECILCASCSTSCPSFWWNPDKFVGPAGLLQAYRFIVDSRDQDTAARLDNLEDPYRLFRCHTIMNCVDVCPKGLNPTRAIGKIKEMIVRRTV